MREDVDVDRHDEMVKAEVVREAWCDRGKEGVAIEVGQRNGEVISTLYEEGPLSEALREEQALGTNGEHMKGRQLSQCKEGADIETDDGELCEGREVL